MKREVENKAGLALIEFLLVTLIIAILLMVIVPRLHGSPRNTSRMRCKQNLKVIASGLQAYLTHYGGFLPANRERTDGTWYPAVEFTGTETGYSWQQILDKLMDADNRDGFIYTTEDYLIQGLREQRLVNLRGHHPAFTCPTPGYGKGLYVGSYSLFRERRMPGATETSRGPINIGKVIESGGEFRDIPVCADGSLANSDESWVRRFDQRSSKLDEWGNPEEGESIHATVTGTFLHKPESGPDAGRSFVNIDFRHEGRANILFLDWRVLEWQAVPDELDGAGTADPDSRPARYRAAWDSMFRDHRKASHNQ